MRYAIVLALASSGCLLLADPPALTDGAGGDGPGPSAPEKGWVELAVGYDVCARHEDGSLWCGSPGELERVGTEEFFSVSNHDDVYGPCAVRADGSLVCGIGRQDGFELAGPFAAVSGGASAGCALRTNRSARCWPQAETVPGIFSSIGAGDRFACGIRSADGGMQCWSIDDLILDDALTTIPPGSFSQVRTADSIACALAVDGSVTCWGYDFDNRTGFVPGSFVDLAINRDHTCAVRADGRVTCWGDGAADPNNGHLFPPSDARLVQLEIGSRIGCGITDDARLVCW